MQDHTMLKEEIIGNNYERENKKAALYSDSAINAVNIAEQHQEDK